MKISIVTISYNQVAFLETAIRSVLDQGYPDIEYIILDGGSTDGSIEVIQKYEHRLAFWQSGKDGGPAAALNAGVGRCTGDIIGVLNSDDFYLSGALGKVVRIFRNDGDTDVVYGNGYMVDANNRVIRRIYSDPWSLTRYAYGASSLMQPGSFFRRHAFQRTPGFNTGNRTCWDGELWVEFAFSGARFVRTPEFLACFRVHPDSIGGSQRLQSVYREEAKALSKRILGRSHSPLDGLVRIPLWKMHKKIGLTVRRMRENPR